MADIALAFMVYGSRGSPPGIRFGVVSDSVDRRGRHVALQMLTSYKVIAGDQL